MPFIETPIKGLLIFQPKVFTDNRGSFFESYNRKTFLKADIDCNFVQDNQSKSSFGTLRGLHLQTNEMAQAKLVRALSGNILDVAVDLRPKSKTFGEYFSIELSVENGSQLFIPRGFAHGFVVLSSEAIFSYKCDNYYSPENEDGIMYNDQSLNIDWKLPAADLIFSDKDTKLKSFEIFKSKL
ncbi:MAG: dTDP-4-dehydrorhamnose 3,5-epimerase [Halobacteriovoraceae bacterium]|jgi:dTDP-4-dehydrorhamnose 3,5-epimerase|nr:dTDP-4-dehydrorhamnose 3,5-epimerase [Halobacteriovoraceae bacterium]